MRVGMSTESVGCVITYTCSIHTCTAALRKQLLSPGLFINPLSIASDAEGSSCRPL